MKLATTTSDFGYYADLKECIKLIHDAGFRYIDIGLGGKFFTENDWERRANDIRDYAEGLGMKFVQAHSPNATILTGGRWEKEVFYGKRSIEICDILGVPNLVVHAAYDKDYDREQWYEENARFYKELFPMAEKTRVCLLTENTTHANLGGYFFMFTGMDMVEFIESIDHPLLQAVWDTGHGTTEGSQYDNIMALGKHLRALHVHDNNGRADEHTMPYTGVLSLDQVMNGLIDVGYDGYFTFEVLNALRRAGDIRQKRQNFEKDNRLAQPTLEMQIDMERLLYHIGKHALTSYGVFEE